MPITSSAKKAQRQTIARTKRLKPYKTKLKSSMKKFVITVKKDKAEAEKLLPKTYSAIDTAAKKRIIHKNNAARKKALVAKMLKDDKVEAKPTKKSTKKEA